jgi:hypothetical protein
MRRNELTELCKKGAVRKRGGGEYLFIYLSETDSTEQRVMENSADFALVEII